MNTYELGGRDTLAELTVSTMGALEYFESGGEVEYAPVAAVWYGEGAAAYGLAYGLSSSVSSTLPAHREHERSVLCVFDRQSKPGSLEERHLKL